MDCVRERFAVPPAVRSPLPAIARLVAIALMGFGLAARARAQCPTFAVPTHFAKQGVSAGVAIGDFNGDGASDLAVANGSDISILLGTRTGTFGAPTRYATVSAKAVVVGDFNGDGASDLAISGNDNVSIRLGTGTGMFGPATTYAVPAGAFSLAVGDVNGDGARDLLVTGYHSTSVSVLLGNGDGTFGAATSAPLGAEAYSLAVGDFNGDGRSDVAVAAYDPPGSRDGVWILLGTGTGTLGAATYFATGFQAQSVAIGDFNGDGRADLAVATFADNSVSVLLGNGNGTFGAAKHFAVGNEPQSVAIGDFDGDGVSDLAVRDQRNRADHGEQRLDAGVDLHELLRAGDEVFGKQGVLLLHLGDVERLHRLVDVLEVDRLGGSSSMCFGVVLMVCGSPFVRSHVGLVVSC